MRKVIDGKVYDTEDARKIGSAGYGVLGDFNAFRESLYRTEKGAYFLAGGGGPKSHYAVPVKDNGFNSGLNGGSGIIPQTPAEAQAWCAFHSNSATIEVEFPSMIECA